MKYLPTFTEFQNRTPLGLRLATSPRGKFRAYLRWLARRLA